ncbi:MAG: tryptophan--tRNA ligase [Candidatus Omnitrophota bacterium]
MVKRKLLSGMRPTGRMHLGHLFGALNNWVSLQDKYDCFYMVADWHALMSEYKDAGSIKDYIIEMAADWIAVGIDPEKSVIFIQSQVKEHLELAMVLSDITPLSWLERCPTYKEQLRELKGKELTTYGFLGYPVLQAADILIYKAEVVPVGKDQLPHLELTREIAKRFNYLCKKKVLPSPEALLTKVSRLLGTDNRKMSKSYNNFIALSDDDKAIIHKVSSMVTDPKKIKKEDPGHPDICNVFCYFKTFTPAQTKDLEGCCRSAKTGCTGCKKNLAEAIIEYIKPMREKREKLLKDKTHIDNILKHGAKKASEVAEKTMAEVYKAVGMK